MKNNNQLLCSVKSVLVLGALFTTTLSVNAQVIVDEMLLSSPDANEFDLFGVEVEISGNLAVISASRNSDQGENSGAAYLFDVTTGQQILNLTPAEIVEDDRFGFSIGIDADTIVVGAFCETDGIDSGAAYVIDAGTGSVRFKLLADDRENFDGFGFSVAVSGDYAIVGATQDDDGAPGTGSAYIFDVNTGQQLHKLTANDASSGDNLGQQVAISGNIAAVSAFYADVGEQAEAGAVYIFDVTTGKQIHKLISDDPTVRAFGFDIDIDGNNVIVCDPNNNLDGAMGAALLFDIATGELVHKLTNNSAKDTDSFGAAVAIKGHSVIVGAPRERGNDGTNAPQRGAAYLFDIRTGEQVAKMIANDRIDFAHFGNAIAVSGRQVIVGATGVAHLLELPCAADLQIDAEKNFFDVSMFLFLYSQGNLRADLTEDNMLNFFDVSAFLSAFTAGCE